MLRDGLSGSVRADQGQALDFLRKRRESKRELEEKAHRVERGCVRASWWPRGIRHSLMDERRQRMEKWSTQTVLSATASGTDAPSLVPTGP